MLTRWLANDAGTLFLLCHKFVDRVPRWQQGHRGRMRLMARAIVIRTDVMEFGT